MIPQNRGTRRNGALSSVNSLEGISLINKVKTTGNNVSFSGIPPIFSRLDSLNNSLDLNGTVYKLGLLYYYLYENISEDAILTFNSVTMDLQDSNVLELKAFALALPNQSLVTYTKQYGLSQVITKNYANANANAFNNDQKTFQPFSEKFYNYNFNTFIDNYTDLTKAVNTLTLNNVKSYTILFCARPTSFGMAAAGGNVVLTYTTGGNPYTFTD